MKDERSRCERELDRLIAAGPSGDECIELCRANPELYGDVLCLALASLRRPNPDARIQRLLRCL